MAKTKRAKGKQLTDLERKQIILSYAEIGTFRGVADLYGVAPNTVKRIVEAEKDIAQIVTLKKEENTLSMLDFLATKNDKAQKFVDLCLDELGTKEKLAAAQVNQITTAMGTVIDKFAPLSSLQSRDTEVYRLDSLLIADGFQAVRRDIINHNHTEYVFSGGRGGTKSSFISLEVIELLKNNPGIHMLAVRQVADTLKDSVYAQLKWSIREQGLEDEFHCGLSPLEITYKPTGQKIYFRGADDPLKIKSIKTEFGYIGILWFEELDQFKGDEAVRSIEQSAIRGGDLAWIFKSFNPPKTKDNWANKYIRTPKETRYLHHSTYIDSQVPAEWLGKTFLEEAEFLKQINPNAYEHEYLGLANGSGGMVFENVQPKAITDEQIKTFDRLYNGVDWGWYPDPWTFNRMYYNKNQRTLYIFDEARKNKENNQSTAKIVRSKTLKNEVVTCDSAEPKSVNDYIAEDLRARGAEKGPGSVEYSMKWLQGLTAIIIDPVRCPHTYQEFAEYEYERNKDGEVISGYPDKNNHHIDATRYAMETIWKYRETPRKDLV